MANPTGCCGCPKNACGCADIPNTLYATFTNGGNCSGFNNLSVAMECDPVTGEWGFSGAVGSCGNFTLAFFCNGLGVDCSDFRLRIKSCDGSTYTFSPAPVCVCPPFSLVFVVTQLGTASCPCCSTGIPTTFFITVTP
jgi:hypothetical protein